ncbi:hypothetical protein IJT10_00065 [bacterium]|nr:hypothetical protein [bacterium]
MKDDGKNKTYSVRTSKGKYRVTFKITADSAVRMNAKRAFVIGNWSGEGGWKWDNKQEMNILKDGSFSLTLTFDEGIYEYKFVVERFDGNFSWESDPYNFNRGEYDNSILYLNFE